ncbi:MAG TPA: FIST N-terminal domain-containing protein, partial [Actinomycetota bacterium]
AMAARAPLRDRATLALVFSTPHHEPAEVLDAVREAASPEAVVGCVGQAVVAGPREVEDGPAVAVWLGRLPDRVEPYAVTFDGERFVGMPEGSGTHLVIADPFTFPADAFLDDLEERRPGTAVIGGMASGVYPPGSTRLFMNDEVVTTGAVGARLPGGVAVRALVSQGCRPVGPPFTVTRAEGSLIEELGGRSPLDRLREIYAAADERDRGLLADGLHLGRVVDEHAEEGDFLIRGVLGADRDTGAMAVGDRVRVGETVRFHVRDADSADDDLRRALAGVDRPRGALLFTCNGRGRRLFAGPDHDAALVAEELGEPPVAGFFAAGELGPVGGRSFLHGFTASLALFYG